jgi:hypothetical protein
MTRDCCVGFNTCELCAKQVGEFLEEFFSIG